MSVIVKGMKMPARCVDCRLCDEIDGTCIALNDNSTACFTGKPDWCPLVEVPTPHGRLGDLDRLEQMFVDIDNAPYSEFDGEEPFYTAEDAAQIIRLSSTIIEGEDEE